MIKIASYASDNRGLHTHTLIEDNELIKLNNEVMNCNDSLMTFKIRLKEDQASSYNNPVIEFLILKSEYDYKIKTINNYENKLFEYVRSEFLKIY